MAVTATGGVQRFKDGREVPDHIYAMWEYPGGRTVTYSSVESCAFENRYEMFFGTKATLVVRNEVEALLFEEGERRTAKRRGGHAARIGRGRRRVRDAARQHARADRNANGLRSDRRHPPGSVAPGDLAFLRRGASHTPLACGPEQAMHSAKACIRGNESISRKTRLEI